eukprot:g17992.t1
MAHMCVHCSFNGERGKCERVGAHHAPYCPRFKGTCKYCGCKGGFECVAKERPWPSSKLLPAFQRRMQAMWHQRILRRDCHVKPRSQPLLRAIFQQVSLLWCGGRSCLRGSPPGAMFTVPWGVQALPRGGILLLVQLQPGHFLCF